MGCVYIEKLIGEFCIHHASTKRTCLEILESLQDAGQIKIVAGEVYTLEYYDFCKHLSDQHSFQGKLNSEEK